jgi:hypothetical protein
MIVHQMTWPSTLGVHSLLGKGTTVGGAHSPVPYIDHFAATFDQGKLDTRQRAAGCQPRGEPKGRLGVGHDCNLASG